MRAVPTLRPTIRALLGTALLTVLLPLAGAELRAQGAGIELKLSPADRETLAAHVLTMEDMRKLAAVSTKVAEQVKRDPKLCATLKRAEMGGAADGAGTLAERVKVAEAEPALRAAFKESGVGAHEFVVITLTYALSMADQMTRVTGRSPFADPVKVNPANGQFLATHNEEIARVMESVPAFCK